ncbi:hypothetical protein M433DRAFT_130715 [Acidomyces richmondensis BFW]|nr:hypothetical protein M433DRAFT_130715 [Acidomyces richmondensis BFW]
MRRQRYLRPNVCLFCACRLAGSIAPPVSNGASFITSQRTLSTNDSPPKSNFGSVDASRDEEFQPSIVSEDVGLTAAERREREALKKHTAGMNSHFPIRTHTVASDARVVTSNRPMVRFVRNLDNQSSVGPDGQEDARRSAGGMRRVPKNIIKPEISTVQGNGFESSEWNESTGVVRRISGDFDGPDFAFDNKGKPRVRTEARDKSIAMSVPQKSMEEKPRSDFQPGKIKKQAMPSFVVSSASAVEEGRVRGWGSGAVGRAPLVPSEDWHTEGKNEEMMGAQDAEERESPSNEQARRRRSAMSPGRASGSRHLDVGYRRTFTTASSEFSDPFPKDAPFGDVMATQHFHPQSACPSRQSPQDHLEVSPIDKNDYHATIIDSQDCIPISSVSEDHSAHWKHLRPRKDPEPRPPPKEREPRIIYHDMKEVDRRFQQHVAQRPNFSFSRTSDVQNENYTAPLFNARPRQNITCGRCLQKGHTARECNTPAKITCNRCGESGHSQRDCPQEAILRREGKHTFGQSFPEGSLEQGDAPLQSRHTLRRVGFEPADKVRKVKFGPAEVTEQSKTVDDVTPSRGRFRAEQNEFDVFQPKKNRSRFRRNEEDQDDALSDIQSRVLSRRARGSADVPRTRERARVRRREEDEDEDDEAAARREEAIARKAARRKERAEQEAAKAAERKAKQQEERNRVHLPEFVTVSTLAQTLKVRYEALVRRLEQLGYDDVFPGKLLNSETSGMIAMEYDLEPIFDDVAAEADERDLKARPLDADTEEEKRLWPSRPPVVTIMGHVDHGKTTILDYLRQSSVAAGEAGGITQHIGAFSVPLTRSGQTVTFLDTPGHAAFLAMRQRGAHVTDIVILVVAADDGVKPQTLEALRHARAARVPMLVAINKIDKEGADVERVKQDLARHGVEIEDFGGDVQVVGVSGKTGSGMEDLEESVVTLAEILDLRADVGGQVEGWVLEATTTQQTGRVATVLVRRGTLRPGSVIVAGRAWGKVRRLRDERGNDVRECGPGSAVEVDGWREQPAAGDEVLQAPSEQKAADVVAWRLERDEREKMGADVEAINEARKGEMDRRERERAADRARKFSGWDLTEVEEGEDDASAALQPSDAPAGPIMVPFIIKADVAGSAEAVSAYLLSACSASPLVRPRVLRASAGAITPTDVELAMAAHAHIIAFNLPADEGMKAQAERAGVRVMEHQIIYRVIDDAREALEEALPPLLTQRVVGEAEIGQKFEISVGGRKKVRIAGCKVRNGSVGKGGRVRVFRGAVGEGEKVYDGTITSLKNVKKDVQEMRKGTECGMGFEGWEDFEVGDLVQCYEEVQEKRRL